MKHCVRGILAMAIICAMSTFAAADVVNGGFETGTTDSWTQLSNGVDVVDTSFFASHSGTYSVDLNSFAPGGVSQTLATVAGQRYTLSFWMAGNPDPVAQGFVTSLARPGGNTTGLSLLSAELPGKRLEILKATVPQSGRVAVLANPAAVSYTLYLHNLTVAAQALGLRLHVVELRRPEELDAAFAAITRAGADALIVRADPAMMALLHGRIADLAATSRLPAMYDWSMSVEAGGLMSSGPSLSDVYRRAATYVDKLLKGAKPADLPVEQPMKFELIINLKTAKALGLTIPPALLFQADEVIQ